jgi:hypothetical protein
MIIKRYCEPDANFWLYSIYIEGVICYQEFQLDNVAVTFHKDYNSENALC